MKIKFFQKTFILVLTLLSVLFQSTALQAKEKNPAAVCNGEEWKILKLVNQERTNKGLTPLSILQNLQTANVVRSMELFTSFSHTRPDGSDYSTILSGINYDIIGENIAVGYDTPQKVMSGWMHSSDHKSNILNNSFTHMGVGHYYNTAGIYQHYWAQIFLGECRPLSISVDRSGKNKSYKLGTTIEKMNRILKVKCRHGISYLPLVSKLCSGYNPFSTGIKKISVTLGGKYTSFKVGLKGINIRKAKVFNVKSKPYNGKTQIQNPKIMVNGTILTKNKDYTISYKHNKKKGKATMIITGKGAYNGTLKIKFKIK